MRVRIVFFYIFEIMKIYEARTSFIFCDDNYSKSSVFDYCGNEIAKFNDSSIYVYNSKRYIFFPTYWSKCAHFIYDLNEGRIIKKFDEKVYSVFEHCGELYSVELRPNKAEGSYLLKNMLSGDVILSGRYKGIEYLNGAIIDDRSPYILFSDVCFNLAKRTVSYLETGKRFVKLLNVDKAMVQSSNSAFIYNLKTMKPEIEIWGGRTIGKTVMRHNVEIKRYDLKTGVMRDIYKRNIMEEGISAATDNFFMLVSKNSQNKKVNTVHSNMRVHDSIEAEHVSFSVKNSLLFFTKNGYPVCLYNENTDSFPSIRFQNMTVNEMEYVLLADGKNAIFIDKRDNSQNRKVSHRGDMTFSISTNNEIVIFDYFGNQIKTIKK